MRCFRLPSFVVSTSEKITQIKGAKNFIQAKIGIMRKFEAETFMKTKVKIVSPLSWFFWGHQLFLTRQVYLRKCDTCEASWYPNLSFFPSCVSNSLLRLWVIPRLSIYADTLRDESYIFKLKFEALLAYFQSFAFWPAYFGDWITKASKTTFTYLQI